MSDINLEAVVAKLDATSRRRALSDAESLTLERAIRAIDNNGGSVRRISKREAARAGVKRDPRYYRRTPA